MKKILLGLAAASLSFGAMATTIGLSNHPFLMKKHVVSTEYNNYLNNGSGMGITAKYLRKVDDGLNIDAGAGFTNGERASRMFIGADYRIIPDYGRQPKFSLKGIAATEDTDGDRINSFGVAPTLSKGFAFWGKEAFPFIALPMTVNLNTNEKEYETTTAVAMGISGNLPLEGFRNIVGNMETNISIRNSYTSFVMGISLPIE